jgi:ectoine hydroxylase-related dioxygenase (phytanoyl-CoA dioxygenase family)
MAIATLVEPENRLSFYIENGYLILPSVLGPSELEVLRSALAEVLAEAEGLQANNEKFALSQPAKDTGRRYVKRVYHPIARHEAFRQLVFHEKILDVLEELIGPDITLNHTKLNLKPPAEGANFQWHQDYPFFPHTNFDLVAVSIFMDDSDESNGCLQVIPGSHKLGPLEHDFSESGQAYGSEVHDKTVFADDSAWVNVEVPAGSVVMHHGCMLHSSAANQSNRARSSFVFEYNATDARQVAGATGAPGWGLQVRGTDRQAVRMAETSFQLSDKIPWIRRS